MKSHTPLASGLIRHLLSLTFSYAIIVSLVSPFLIAQVDAAPDAEKNSRPSVTTLQTRQPSRAREGELIVRFREEATEQEKNMLAVSKRVRRAGVLRGESRVEKLELSVGDNPEALADALRAHPAVEFAEPNFLIERADMTPNDPRFAEQWGLRNTGSGGGQVGADIGAGGAWERTTGASDMTIAVIDSGIDFTHPDLQNNRWANRRERDNNRDDDRNGMADDLSGWDWVTDSGVIVDEQGHGTRVAGIIAAQGDNGVGISGVMWRAGLMSLRVLDNTGTGDIADAVEAIDYAVANGAQVINCSWGLEQESAILRDAIERAGRRGVVVVCAAGNEGRNIDGTPYYPASFSLSNLLTVAATDGFDQLTSWSNWSASRVAVGAPGIDLLTTQMGGGYATMTGTSAAAPLVTGIAGLVKTERPWLSAAGTATAIVEGTRRMSGLDGKVSSGGVANAAGAIRALQGTGFDYGTGDGGDQRPGNQRPGNNQAAPRPGGNPGRSRDYLGRAPDPNRGAPDADPARRNMPNLDEERRRTPHAPSAPASIRANDLGRCDSGCGGSFPPSNGTDPHFTVQRIDPVNQTGEEGVDLGSRNFNWSTQLLSLKGRASMDLTLSLDYNSLVWTKQSGRMRFNPARGLPTAGFRTGFPTLQPRFGVAGTIVAYLMVLPSGGHVEMSRTFVNGSQVFMSQDNTYTQLTFEGGVAVVRMKDGKQLFFTVSVESEMRCTQIKDRNGNFISISYNSLGRPTTVTDTLGRVITFRYDANDYLVAIEQPWTGGVTHQWATFSYGALTIQTNFRNADGTSIPIQGPANGTSIPVLTRVGLGDGSSYDFSYNSWGQVHKITHKAADSYANSYTRYSLPLDATNPESDCPRFRGKYEWAYDWNNGAEAVTAYSVDPNNAWSQMTMPDGLTVYKEYFATDGWQRGLTTKSETIYNGVVKQWTVIDWTQDDVNSSFSRNPRPFETNVHDAEGNRKRTTIEYHSYSLPHIVREWGGANGDQLLRRTVTHYALDARFVDRRIIGLLSAQLVYDGGGALVSKVDYHYDWDNHYSALTPSVQHEPLSYLSGRGNLVGVRRYNIDAPDDIYAAVWPQLYGYDRAGSVQWIQDGNNHRTNVSYVDSFADGSDRGTLAYPTVVTNADGFSTTLQYRHDIGTTTRVQDPKGAFQTMTYDGAGRIQQITNGINGYYSRWSYPSSMLGVYTYLPSQHGSGEVFAGQFLDGAGRVRRTSVDHPNSSGGYSGRQIDYDVMGRVVRQSNPTESDGMWNAAGDDYLAGGWRWTTQEYDWKDRPTLTTNPDNTTREAEYTGCGCAGGETQMWRDESGRWRRLIKDVLGRLKQVDELGRDKSLYATTTYTYNGRDQITQITQAGQTPRTFEYDGHGRLWRRTTPEQGLTQYSYYTDDTMQSVTDARGAVASCGYNGRRLITSVNYTVPADVAPTNNVTFGYDEAGNRSSMTEKDKDNNVVGSTTYNYDTLSRMKWEERTFGGLSGAYRISYGYNSAGSLTSVTNPWDVEVGYIHDRVGRLRGVSGANYAGVSFYAHNMDYRAFGAVKFMNYGNNPRTFSASYDARMRMTERKVPDVMWWKFAYDKFGEQTGRVTYAKNMYDATLNRSYEYDQWRRLYASHTGAEADVHVGLRAYQNPPIQQHEYGPYAQLRFYDVWGNQVQRIGWGGANPSLTASYTNNRRDGHQYDFAGNLTGDGGQEFTYDATGQQAWATAGSTSQAYDGNALRTRRVENGHTTYYLRSTVLGGQVVAEIDQWGGWTRGYVYAGTQLLALQQYVGVEWVHQDMVTKSQRLTNVYGTVISIVDLDPWGGETAASVSQSRQPQRYTTYKRDGNQSDEAMARRYNRWWGRFDQPDPHDGSYDLTDPQSLNRYSYVQNDPVNFIDPTGLDGTLDDGIGAARDALKSGACRAIFQGVDAGKLLDQYANPANNLLRVGPTTLGGTEMPEETAAVTNPRSGIITINSNGFYFSGQVTSFSGDRTSVTEIRAFGLYGLSPSEMRGAIILHELLHTQKLIPSDAGNIKQSQLNSEKVRLFCFVLPNMPVSTTGNIITELRGGRGSSGGRGGGGSGGGSGGGRGDLSWLSWLYEGLLRAPERSRVH